MRQCLNNKIYALRECINITSDDYLSEDDVILNETTYSLPALKRASSPDQDNISDETTILKKKFMRLGKLRYDILGMFIKLEEKELSILSSTVYNALLEKVEQFITLFNEVSNDIDAYKTISFKHKDKNTGKIVERPFTEDELETMLEVWTEDADTFETRIEMLSYENALSTKYPSITKAYNSKSLGSEITSDYMEKLFEIMIFADYRMFNTYKSFIKRLIMSSVPAITIKRTIDSIVYDYKPTTNHRYNFKKKVLELMNLNESVNEGFYNPFDDEDEYLDSEESQFKKFHVEKKDPDMIDITKVKMWNTNVPNKVVCKSNGCFAGKSFTAGDIIEESPVRIIPSDAMYSRSIRDAAFQFELDDGSLIYGIPLGYISCYRTRHNSGLDGNVEYDLDPESLRVTILAKKNIRKGQELVLDTNDSDFANEYNETRFKHNQDVEPIYTADIKWV